MERMLKIAVRVPPEEIFYVSWTIDSYDGIGVVRTDDPKEGTLAVFTTRGFKEDVLNLLRALEAEGINVELLGEEEVDAF